MSSRTRLAIVWLVAAAVLAGPSPAAAGTGPSSGLRTLHALPTASAGVSTASLSSPTGLRDCAAATGCVGPCFGAAARDPLNQPCDNPNLAFSVVPAPRAAELETGDGCVTQGQIDASSAACVLGPVPALENFALLGDSHAGHWRPALATVANANGWRGLPITRTSCPFSEAFGQLREPLKSECIAWKRTVLAWFKVHPEVNIVFVSADSGAPFAPRNKHLFATKVNGYIAAWAALPPSVQHIIVIRDTPLNRNSSLACVERAISRHVQPGVACAVPRHLAVRPDPEVAAARRLGPDRVQVADLTQLFCDRRLCYPVVGGVLVHKDVDHLTTEFSATLGRFLLRKLKSLMSIPGWESTNVSAAGAP